MKHWDGVLSTVHLCMSSRIICFIDTDTCWCFEIQDACNNYCSESGTCYSPAGTDCNDGDFCKKKQLLYFFFISVWKASDTFWTGTLTNKCNGNGVCVGTGNLCAGGPVCKNHCNSAAGNCNNPAGTSCSDGKSLKDLHTTWLTNLPIIPYWSHQEIFATVKKPVMEMEIVCHLEILALGMEMCVNPLAIPVHKIVWFHKELLVLMMELLALMIIVMVNRSSRLSEKFRKKIDFVILSHLWRQWILYSSGKNWARLQWWRFMHHQWRLCGHCGTYANENKLSFQCSGTWNCGCQSNAECSDGNPCTDDICNTQTGTVRLNYCIIEIANQHHYSDELIVVEFCPQIQIFIFQLIVLVLQSP